MSKLHLLIVGFNSVPKVRRLRRKLLVCNASHTWLFLATIPSNLIHYWLGPNSEGFWNLWGYLVLPRRPIPVHARPWWQWCHFPCHLTLRFCILIFKDNLSSLYHAFNCQAHSLGCLVVKLAVPVKPKGDFHSYNLLSKLYKLVSGLHMLWSVTRVMEWGGWLPTLTCLSTSGQLLLGPKLLRNFDNISTSRVQWWTRWSRVNLGMGPCHPSLHCQVVLLLLVLIRSY